MVKTNNCNEIFDGNQYLQIKKDTTGKVFIRNCLNNLEVHFENENCARAALVKRGYKQSKN